MRSLCSGVGFIAVHIGSAANLRLMVGTGFILWYQNSRLWHGEDHVAHLLPRFYITVGFNDLLQGKHPVNDRPESAPCCKVPQVQRIIPPHHRDGEKHLFSAPERRSQSQENVLRALTEFRGNIDTLWFKQGSALPEGAFAHSVENEVKGVRCLGEVLGLVVDDFIGAQRSDQCNMWGSRYNADVGPHMPPPLSSRGSDGTRGAVDQNAAAGADLLHADGAKGIMATFSQGGCLGKAKTLRQHGHRPTFRDHLILRMAAETGVIVSEHPITRPES